MSVSSRVSHHSSPSNSLNSDNIDTKHNNSPRQRKETDAMGDRQGMCEQRDKPLASAFAICGCFPPHKSARRIVSAQSTQLSSICSSSLPLSTHPPLQVLVMEV